MSSVRLNSQFQGVRDSVCKLRVSISQRVNLESLKLNDQDLWSLLEFYHFGCYLLRVTGLTHKLVVAAE